MIALTQLNCNWGFYITSLYLIIFFGDKGKENDIKTYVFYAVSMWNVTFVRLCLVRGWKSGMMENSFLWLRRKMRG